MRNVPGQGRGLFATEEIRKGQQLLHIPDNLLLTAEKAAKECCFGSVLTDASLPDWTVLASYLVELWDQYKEGNGSSYWAQYIALLPEDTGCILEWTDKEVLPLFGESRQYQRSLYHDSPIYKDCVNFGHHVLRHQVSVHPSACICLVSR